MNRSTQIALGLMISFFSLNNAAGYGDRCSSVRCYQKKSIEERRACREEQVACMNRGFEEDVAKQKSKPKGLKSTDIQRLISKLEKKLEGYRERKLDLQETIRALEVHLQRAKNLEPAPHN